MNFSVLPDGETVVLGIIRDSDHALTWQVILKRSGYTSGQLDTIINRLVDGKRITFFAEDTSKKTENRRYLTADGAIEAADTGVAEHLWELSAGGLLYFAYGSDLDPAEMYRERCPGSHFICRGHLEGFSLAFDRYLEEWRGTVASIKYSRDERGVWGVLYGVGAGDWSTLDRLEDVPRQNRRVMVPVRTSFGLFCARCYQSVPGDKRLPSKAYIDRIVKGSEFFGLPQKYIRQIKSLPVCPE